jgi:hypothetical protein
VASAPAHPAPHAEQLRAVIRAVVIRSAQTFELAGRPVAVDGAAAPVLPGFPTHPIPIVERLRQELYQHAYCRDLRAGASEPPVASSEDGGDAAFARALGAANRGRDRWDAGWSAHAILPAGQVIAAKGTMLRTLWPGEYVFPAGRGMGAVAGAEVTAFSPKESWTLQPGYYYALGAITDEQDDRDLVRVYWNVSADGAPRLVELLTGALTRYELPYRLKCQAHPAAFARDDAAVLFVTRRHFRLVAEIAAAVLPELRDRLRERTPLFTKRLAPGVAAAEDPGGGDSFGTHRCALVAEGLWRAFESGESSDGGRLAAIQRAFADRGLDPARPHLRRGSTDIYELPAAGA